MRRHPIQAIDVRVDRVSVRRRMKRPNEPEITPMSSQPAARLMEVSEDGKTFSIRVGASVTVPLIDQEVWAASLVLTASFVSEIPLTRRRAAGFARASGVFLVWPYARTYLHELARVAGVPAPLLPLVLRTN